MQFLPCTTRCVVPPYPTAACHEHQRSMSSPCRGAFTRLLCSSGGSSSAPSQIQTEGPMQQPPSVSRPLRAAPISDQMPTHRSCAQSRTLPTIGTTMIDLVLLLTGSATGLAEAAPCRIAASSSIRSMSTCQGCGLQRPSQQMPSPAERPGSAAHAKLVADLLSTGCRPCQGQQGGSTCVPLATLLLQTQPAASATTAVSHQWPRSKSRHGVLAAGSISTCV